MLHVYRADRADALVAALGNLLASPLPDPFASELVGVPTRGMERWLTQSLANRLGTSGPGRRDGIVANVRFPSPREIADQAVAAACEIDLVDDGWASGRVVWPLLATVDEAIDESWLSVLAEHLRDSSSVEDRANGLPRRLVAVRHLARLFDRYALHRPTMLGQWATGNDVDGSGRVLPPQAAWQPELWRRMRERIQAPDPSQRLGLATERIREEPTVLDLPDRLSLFGLTRLPAAQLELLRSIAAARDVHLFLLHPSPVLWTEVATVAHGHGRAITRRAEDPTAACARNRILASWGRDARELQLVLGSAASDHHTLCLQAPNGAGTLLARLQADVHEDRDAPGPLVAGQPDDRPSLAPDDRSVEVHSCHGRARQVEVLRDAVLHVLREHPELEPRDVIVMCPDIEAFAPLIYATFGVGDVSRADEEDAATGDDVEQEAAVAPDLRVRLADRALRQTNPLLGTLARLLELADQRLTASQVLDFADRAPVRRRFQLEDDDLVRLEEWIAGSGIRWGLDAEHRSPFKLTGVAANTWRAGLDRMLLGVTMTEDEQRMAGGVLPFDDVESGAIELVGRVAELLHRVAETIERFGEPRTIDEWAVELASAADLLMATGPRDTWQRSSLDGLLSRLVQDAAASGPSAPTLDLAELRELLSERLAGRPTRANFRTGHLTFCTLSPMRSVPHRVVCLLGLDDDTFPRKAAHDGDDLIIEDPFVGDHDGRTEDRQMLLDALLAAEDKLIVTYSGNDERTNAARPPAVPVGELLDAIDRTVRAPDGLPRDAITIRHSLQPFDPRNFTIGRPGTPFGFDPVMLAGARALVTPREPRQPFLAEPLPEPDAGVLDLEDVVRFVQHPARAFLRQRLGVSLGDFHDELADALPIELDGLEQWAIGDRMLRARLAGQPLDATVEAERARGALPPGRLADAALTALQSNVTAITAAAAEVLGLTAQLASVDARVQLADGRLISGTVAGIDGHRLQSVVYSRLAPKHRLAAWVRLLTLTAARPDQPWEAMTIGRERSDAPGRAKVTTARIAPLGVDSEQRQRSALAHLDDLLDLVDRGMREPPPLACATSAAYAQAAAKAADPVKAAGKAWTSDWNYPKEDRELEHQRLLGGVVALDRLLSEPARSDERGAVWDETEPSRFGRWAVRLWAGLLAAEEVSDR